MRVDDLIEKLTKLREETGNAQVMIMSDCPEHGIEFVEPDLVSHELVDDDGRPLSIVAIGFSDDEPEPHLKLVTN